MEGRANDFAAILRSIQKQNFKDDQNWTLAKLEESCKLAFHKNRFGGDRTTVAMACNPKLRRALLEKGKLYILREVISVDDYHSDLLLTVPALQP